MQRTGSGGGGGVGAQEALCSMHNEAHLETANKEYRTCVAITCERLLCMLLRVGECNYEDHCLDRERKKEPERFLSKPKSFEPIRVSISCISYMIDSQPRAAFVANPIADGATSAAESLEEKHPGTAGSEVAEKALPPTKGREGGGGEVAHEYSSHLDCTLPSPLKKASPSLMNEALAAGEGGGDGKGESKESQGLSRAVAAAAVAAAAAAEDEDHWRNNLDLRPADEGTAVSVELNYFILGLTDIIKGGEQTFRMDFYFDLYWTDPRLVGMTARCVSVVGGGRGG